LGIISDKSGADEHAAKLNAASIAVLIFGTCRMYRILESLAVRHLEASLILRHHHGSSNGLRSRPGGKVNIRQAFFTHRPCSSGCQ
jgi:hypothetical protein